MYTNRDDPPIHHEQFFRTSTDLLCVLHRDGRFIRANRVFRDVLGYPEETLVGAELTTIVHPEGAARLREFFGSSEEGDALLRFEARFVHRDLTYRKLAFSLRRVAGEAAVYGMGREVPDEEPWDERRRRQQLLRKMQETARVGGWEVDCRTMEMYWTDETYRMHEVPPGYVPVVEQGIAFYAPESRQAIIDAWTACVKEGRPYDMQLQIITAKGRRLWVRTVAEPVIEDGEVVRIIGAFHDIEEFKIRELELEDKLAIIEQQRSAIHQLSAPIIQVWDGVLALPVVGGFDRDRAGEITARLLEAVVRTCARYAILDLTGVDAVDEVTADHLVRILRALQLLGAEGLVTGVRPAVAQTMTSLGAGFAGARTLGNLRDAIKLCMRERTAPRSTPAR
jgi:rsbT co-antagonist protein RsbR